LFCKCHCTWSPKHFSYQGPTMFGHNIQLFFQVIAPPGPPYCWTILLKNVYYFLYSPIFLFLVEKQSNPKILNSIQWIGCWKSFRSEHWLLTTLNISNILETPQRHIKSTFCSYLPKYSTQLNYRLFKYIINIHT